jgi:hypothetical protein
LIGEIAGLFTCPENAAFGLRIGGLAELTAVATKHVKELVDKLG